MKDTKKVLPIAIGIGVLVLIFLLVLFVRSFGGKFLPASPQTVNTIILTNVSGSQFSLDSSGNAIWTVDGKTTSALWSEDKTRSFFEYYYDNWAQNASVSHGSATVNSNDELTNAVISEGNGGGGGGNTGGDDISQYFGSPTPTPGGGSGGSGGGGSGGGDDGAPSWCKHWRLSYCADPPPNTSTPIPTPTPSNGPTPLPPDCNNPGNQETGKTVIGNELCLPSPTPTATP